MFTDTVAEAVGVVQLQAGHVGRIADDLPEAVSDESARKTRVVGTEVCSRPDPDLPRRLVRTGFRSDGGQCAIQVGYQIFAILDADGQSHEIVSDT